MHAPAVQVAGGVQSPHESVPPQPSAVHPQETPAKSQVVCKELLRVEHKPRINRTTGRKRILRAARTGMHEHDPLMHVLGDVQLPHESVPPQPSSVEPHVTPAASQVVCT